MKLQFIYESNNEAIAKDIIKLVKKYAPIVTYMQEYIKEMHTTNLYIQTDCNFIPARVCTWINDDIQKMYEDNSITFFINA